MSKTKAHFHGVYNVARADKQMEMVKGNEVERFAGEGKGTDCIGIYKHAKNLEF